MSKKDCRIDPVIETQYVSPSVGVPPERFPQYPLVKGVSFSGFVFSAWVF